MRIPDALLNKIFRVAMFVNRRRYWPPLKEAATDPKKFQDERLIRILKKNAATEFGRKYGFDGLNSVEEFRNAVPVQDYESLRPLIEDQELNKTQTLTVETPVLYAQTSGTSGQPKYVPISETTLSRISYTQRLYASLIYANTKMFDGRVAGIGSPAVEGELPGGSSFGSASGLVYEGMPSVVRGKYVIPPEVLSIKDHDLRYKAIATLCLAERSITGFATANPSTLSRLRSVIIQHWDECIKCIESGLFGYEESLREEQNIAINKKLSADPKRSHELAQIRENHGDQIGFQHLWHDLNTITTWTGGSAGFALKALLPYLDESTKVIELGYSASEARFTICIEPDTNQCLPLLKDNWFEFVDRDVREGNPKDLSPALFLGVEELELGKSYYIFVTTFDGLYRYDMNDIVKVTGKFLETPTISFVQKGKGVTNITGEKLSESQVLEAIDFAQNKLNLELSFFIFLADEQNSNYKLYAESASAQGYVKNLTAHVEEFLCSNNIEYKSKRGSERLKSIESFEIATGTGELYRTACVSGGQRDAQFKYQHLQYQDDCTFDFDKYQLKSETVSEDER